MMSCGRNSLFLRDKKRENNFIENLHLKQYLNCSKIVQFEVRISKGFFKMFIYLTNLRNNNINNEGKELALALLNVPFQHLRGAIEGNQVKSQPVKSCKSEVNTTK